MPRYVILLHEVPPASALGQRPTHWDLMLEHEGVLRTWALPRQPVASGPSASEALPAEPLADHRLAYLDYEGPVSGNRGSVRRWDEGEYEIVRESANMLVARLHGRRGLRQLTLEQQDGGHCWTVSFGAAPIRG